MHPSFTSLPQPLLHQLGRWQWPLPLAQALVHAARPQASDQDGQALAQNLRQNMGEQMCLSLNGLGVLLHRAPHAPGDATADTAWGLHSICWHTAAASATPWNAAWPEGVDPRTVRPAQLVQLLARDPPEALIAPGMVCFEADGCDGRSWALMGLFDAANQRLLSLHLSRLGDWIAMAPEQSMPLAG